MAYRPRTLLGLPFVTNPTDHTKSTKRFACVDPYQTLPDPVLAVRNPLVHLDWSTNAYHSLNLGLTFGCTAFTNDYHRGEGQGH